MTKLNHKKGTVQFYYVLFSQNNFGLLSLCCYCPVFVFHKFSIVTNLDWIYAHQLINLFTFTYTSLIFALLIEFYKNSEYRNDPKFSDRYAWANSADPDQTAPSGAAWSGSTLFAIPSASFGLITLW